MGKRAVLVVKGLRLHKINKKWNKKYEIIKFTRLTFWIRTLFSGRWSIQMTLTFFLA